ncbi:hypothetical protein DER44DRAFT_743908 [Fusarium oxysporum]|nr:hypothetical protein DER44DRAFT_743908 [Fusarium oxysporum]
MQVTVGHFVAGIKSRVVIDCLACWTTNRKDPSLTYLDWMRRNPAVKSLKKATVFAQNLLSFCPLSSLLTPFIFTPPSQETRVNWIQRWSTRIVPEKPPNEILKEEQQQANANLDAAYEKYKSEGTPDSFGEVERCMHCSSRQLKKPGSAIMNRGNGSGKSLLLMACSAYLATLQLLRQLYNSLCERASTQHLSHSDTIENQNETTTLRYFRVNNSPGTEDSLSSESQSPAIEPIHDSSPHGQPGLAKHSRSVEMSILYLLKKKKG